ncbi:HPF/RaiA family ribosome-associated protein [Ciceribacter ferrooxidans]|uniref:HPF/RaiA family ribosome-associated protein n=1 Tax=Ciceribacter ferrooxidans TaxID=2509717 RepID=A0A4Q2S6D5_9HYPH|nr:HPF/RaiA family ribosome-associated protein [Ciceribacter ferrooxidans]RYB97860.1 HPF/RaiA family ribosome-associated protein [Ciceribacter ferrooxidans]
MEVTPRVTFRGMDHSEAVEAAVHERIERLSRFHDHITSCSVVIEAPHKHSQKGKIYHVRVNINVPGREIVVGREAEENHAHEDVLVAIRDSFDAAQRQLEDVVRKMSSYRVKAHPVAMRGTVARVVPEEGFGFILGADGREYFFRRESVTTENWAALGEGTKVRFAEHDGEKGPYASAVTPD